MNVIYISYDGMADTLGQSQVIPYLIGLTKKGHSISIVSCEKKDRYKEQKGLISKLLMDNSIAWHPVAYSSLPSVISKQKNLFFLKKKAFEVNKKYKADIIHCRSYMAALIGLDMKKKLGVKFIFDMRGFWADERIDGNIWKHSNALHHSLYNYFKKKEIKFLTQADYIISLTENAKKEILSWPSVKNKKLPIEVIPCCVDLNFFSKSNVNANEQQQLAKSMNITSSDFIVCYLGSIGTWYMLDEMLDFFNVLQKQKTNARFLFVTPDDEELVMAAARNKKIPLEKIIVRSATRKQVPVYLSLSHIALYFIKPSYSKKASSPTKTGEVMSMGIPIITNTGIGDSDELFSQSKAGLIVNAFTNEEYKRVINEIDVILNTDKIKIRQEAENNFSLDIGVQKYNAVYKKLN
jgi:glycosyltransferase involved in cell wall biosynthesis